MHRAVIRLRDIQDEYAKGTVPLYEKRLNETQRQNQLDEIKNSVGLTFKKKQEMEKSINDSEKRLKHAMTESTKLQNKINHLLKNRQELENFNKLPSNTISSENHLEEGSAVADKLKEYIDKNATLFNKLRELQQANAEKSKLNDELRSKYQIESSKAAESAQTLKILQESMKSLENEVNGPLTKFSTESLKKELERLQNDFQSLKAKNKFLKNYITLMNRQYDLKNKNNVQVEKAAANGTRFRSTRSNTPNYT